MHHFGHTLRDLIKNSHMQNNEFCKRAGISSDTLYKAFRSAKPTIKPATYRDMAEALDLTPQQLDARWKDDAGDGLPPGSDFDPMAQRSDARAGYIPVLGKAAAGRPVDFEYELESDRALPPSLYPFPQHWPAAIIAHGNSMFPLIKDGDLVIIARHFPRAPKTGDIVAVTLVQQNGHTLKHLEIAPAAADGALRYILKPHNTHDHLPQTLAADEIKAMAIVVGWYHPHQVDR